MGATLVATAEHYVVDVGLGFAFTDTAWNGEGHSELDFPDAQHPACPHVLDEPLATGLEHDVRSEPMWIESAPGRGRAQVPSGARRHDVDRQCIKESPGDAHDSAVDHLVAVFHP